MDFEFSEVMTDVRNSARAFAARLAAEEHGGMGLDPLSYAVAMEELACVSASYQGCLSVHNSLVCAAGELIGAYSLSEPGAGSDAGSIATAASPACSSSSSRRAPRA